MTGFGFVLPKNYEMGCPRRIDCFIVFCITIPLQISNGRPRTPKAVDGIMVKLKKTQELKVFISSSEPICDDCNENLGRGAWIFPAGEKRALCLSCADLDHLVFLPSGDAALTRRSRKYATLSAVVLQWSRARKRYERQGLLVESAALEQAERDCLADAEARERRRGREALRRERLDRDYSDRFAQTVRSLFPACPAGRETVIAEHACLKNSGRIGRSAPARRLEAGFVRLAVVAHVRHAETPYDELLMMGHDRWEARDLVAEGVDRVLVRWEDPDITILS